MIDVSNTRIENESPYDIVTTIRTPNDFAGIILFNAGTCIIRSFYDPIAQFFSEQGFLTIQYDYIGVGDSRPTNLKGLEHSIYDWGSHDIEVMSQYIDKTYGTTKPKYMIAHSMGGQIVGLTPSIDSFRKIITMASSYGNYRNFNLKDRMRYTFAAKTVFPLLTRIYGYFPGEMMGIGIDWPKGVAEDWVRWNKEYFSLRQWMDKLGRRHYFDKSLPPMTSYVFTDDIMATAKCIPHFQLDYPQADIRLTNPLDFDLESLGHFNAFKPKSIAFWRHLLEELQRTN